MVRYRKLLVTVANLSSAILALVCASITTLPVSANVPFEYSKGYSEKASNTAVVIPTARGKQDPRNDYMIELLKLALIATEADFGGWSISYNIDNDNNTQSRNVNMLANGSHTLNLIWVMTDRNKESLLKPVRIPVYRGLIGYRVCLLPKGHGEMLKDIRTPAQFAATNITIGQGHDWPDTKILSSNGFNVTTSPNYDSLFKMLKMGRFDCFLRGLNEVYTELSLREGLELDYHLAIYYPSPAYFFVNRANIPLHNRLKKGLETTIQDGSFNRLFKRYYDEAILKTRLNSRHIIYLNNPLLSDETPVGNEALWYKAQEQQQE